MRSTLHKISVKSQDSGIHHFRCSTKTRNVVNSCSIFRRWRFHQIRYGVNLLFSISLPIPTEQLQRMVKIMNVIEHHECDLHTAFECQMMSLQAV